MVHIYGKYYAVPNNMGFTLQKETGVNDKGEMKYVVIGYYGNMEEICVATYRDYVNNKCSARAIELYEAIQIMREANEMFKNIFRELEGYDARKDEEKEN